MKGIIAAQKVAALAEDPIRHLLLLQHLHDPQETKHVFRIDEIIARSADAKGRMLRQRFIRQHIPILL